MLIYQGVDPSFKRENHYEIQWYVDIVEIS